MWLSFPKKQEVAMAYVIEKREMAQWIEVITDIHNQMYFKGRKWEGEWTGLIREAKEALDKTENAVLRAELADLETAKSLGFILKNFSVFNMFKVYYEDIQLKHIKDIIDTEYWTDPKRNGVYIDKTSEEYLDCIEQHIKDEREGRKEQFKMDFFKVKKLLGGDQDLTIATYERIFEKFKAQCRKWDSDYEAAIKKQEAAFGEKLPEFIRNRNK